jgi:hypothetical protein
MSRVDGESCDMESMWNLDMAAPSNPLFGPCPHTIWRIIAPLCVFPRHTFSLDTAALCAIALQNEAIYDKRQAIGGIRAEHETRN